MLHGDEFDGVIYANCGDWVESCTALAEEPDGTLRLIHWADESFQLLDRVNGHLARNLASADVLVFPRRTDTFGLVMLEAMASGVPVAAYPVEGPLDA